jgi:hypothetical protein
MKEICKWCLGSEIMYPDAEVILVGLGIPCVCVETEDLQRRESSIRGEKK